MRIKIYLNRAVSLCLSGFLAGVLALQASGQTATIAGGDTYTSIHEAVAAASAGNVVTLSAGTFTLTESLVLDFAIELAGQGESTIIQVAPDAVHGIYVPSSNVTLRNFRVESPQATGQTAAIRVGTGNAADATSATHFINDGFSLEDVTIAGALVHGLELHGAQNVSLDGLTVSNSQGGAGLSILSSVGVGISGLATSGNAVAGVSIRPADPVEAFSGLDAPAAIAFSGTTSLGDANCRINVHDGELLDGSTWVPSISNADATADVLVPASMTRIIHVGLTDGSNMHCLTAPTSTFSEAANWLAYNADGVSSDAVVVEIFETGALEVSEALDIQDALDYAAEGGVVTLVDGTHPLDAPLTVSKGLTLEGQSEVGTVISCSGLGLGQNALSIAENTSGVTLRNFTLDGSERATFGIHVRPGTSNTTLTGLTATDCLQNGISFTGTTNTDGINTVTDITVTNNGLSGLGFGASQYVTVSYVTASGNAGSDIGIYIGSYDAQPNDELIFGEGLDLNAITYTIEANDPEGFEVVASTNDPTDVLYDYAPNVRVPAEWNHVLITDVNQVIPPGTSTFSAYALMKAESYAGAAALAQEVGYLENIAGYSLETGNWLVAPGMSAQAAIDRAEAGDTVTLLNGTHAFTSTVNVNKVLTLEGESEAGTTLSCASLSEAYGIAVQSPSVTLRNLTVDGSGTAVFGIHVQPNTSNIWLKGLTASNCVQNGISFTGTNEEEGESTVEEITVTNNGLTGLGFGASQSVFVRDITGSGNAGSDIGIYIGDYTEQPNNFLVFAEPLNVAVISYTIEENDPAGFEVVASTDDESDVLYDADANVVVPADWNHVLVADVPAADPPAASAFTVYALTKSAFYSTLAGAYSSSPIFQNIAGYSMETGNWLVAPGMSAQTAIDRAEAGDTVTLLDGTHAFTSTVNVNKAITLEGASEAGTTLSCTSLTEAYGIAVQSPSSALRNLTVDGSGTAVFGIHVQPNTSNVSLSGLTATNCVQNGISFTGTNNAEGGSTVTDITVTNNGLTGLGFGASQYVTVSDVTASENAGSDIGIYIGSYDAQPNDHLVFGGNLDVNAITYTIEANDPAGFEVVASTVDDTDALYVADANVVVPAEWNHVLITEVNQVIAPGTSTFSAYALMKPESYAAAAAAAQAAGYLENIAGYSLETGNWLVAPGMSAQVAIDRAEAGDTVTLLDGTHAFTSTVNVNKAITLEGQSEAGTTLSCGDLTEAYGIAVQSPSAALRNLTVDGSGTAIFGIHVQPNTSDVTLSGLTASNCVQNGISFTGTNNAEGGSTVTNVTVTNNGLTGLGFGASQYVTVSDVTGEGNASSDIGIYIGSYDLQRNDNLVFQDPLNVNAITYTIEANDPEGFEVVASTVDDTDALYNAEANVLVPADWNHVLITDVNQVIAPGASTFSGYALMKEEAYSAAAAAAQTVGYLENIAGYSLETGHWIVAEGMSIQAAADRAAAGDFIDLHAGSFTESVTTAVPLTIEGVGAETVLGAEADWVLDLASGTAADERTTLRNVRLNAAQNGIKLHAFSTLENVEVSDMTGTAVQLLGDDAIIAQSQLNNNAIGLEVAAADAPSNLTVTGSQFNGNSVAGWSMMAPTGQVTSLSDFTASGNLFEANAMGIASNRLAGLTLTGNAFSNTTADVSLDASELAAASATVNDNAFSGTGVAVQYTGSESAAAQQSLTIERNAFTGYTTGVQFGEDGVASALPGTLSLTQNSFVGNGSPAVVNQTGSALTLSCNWHGGGNVAAVSASAHPTVDIASILISGVDTDAEAVGFQPAEGAACEAFGGCALSGACNYDADATVLFPDAADCDFDSCTGCMDDSACNYDDSATISENSQCTYPPAHYDCDGNCLADADGDGVCDELEVEGCVDTLACNYDSDPTTDANNALCTYPSEDYLDCAGACLNDADGDGVCDELEVGGCTDAGACNYSSAATDDDGTCEYASCAGCTVVVACNYDSSATISAPETCTYPDEAYLDCDGACLNDADEDGVCDEDEVAGCTDSSACNYDADATDSTDTCTYPEQYYDCDGACLLDTDGDGVCNALEVFGCTVATACNFDPEATQLDASCVFGDCSGCTIESACNYDPTVYESNNDDCEYPELPYTDCNGDCLLDNNANGICDQNEVFGCMDPTATNYNPNANVNGGCISELVGCMIPAACNYLESATIMSIEDCDFTSCAPPATSEIPGDPVSGCTEPYACNYNGAATVDDGSCEYNTCVGCMNPLACDYDASYIYNSACDFSCYGCTTENAANYDPTATLDDGSCLYVPGCNVPSACNFDPAASVNNGSCDFESCAGCGDATACNYDDTVTLNDVATCTYPDEGYDCNGDCLADTDTDGVCDPFEVEGCLDPTACNYAAGATDLVACEFPATHYDCDGVCLNDTDGDGVCDELEVVGCTNAGACNYNANATDEGSCEFTSCVGCMDNTACNYDSSATLSNPLECTYPDTGYDCNGDCLNDSDSDGVCDEFEVVGCTDSSACNYDASATDDGSCEYPVDVHGVAYVDCDGACLNDVDGDGVCDEDEVDGCMDEDACNYDAGATDDLGCEYLTCAGCSLISACNYNPTADIINNSTCSFADPGFDCDGNCIDINNNGTCDSEEATLIDCFDFAACNYNENTNVVNNSLCVYRTAACDTCSGETDGTGTVVDNDQDDDGVCDADEITGCQDDTACNYNVNATDPPAAGQECTYTSLPCDVCSGEQDGTGTVVDGDPDDDGVCAPDEVTGCQDAAACNYNVNATDPPAAGQECAYATGPCDVCSGLTDGTGFVVYGDVDGDGICNTAETEGCVYPTACNYDASATEDDGSCIFPTGCETCSGEQDGTGTVLANDDDADGVCNDDEIAGCIDATACNYNQYATESAGNCVYATGCDSCAGGISGDGYVLDGDADDDGTCDVDEVAGCTDGGACNYDAAATDDDGTCLFADGSCEVCDGNGGVELNDSDNDGVCDADEIAGCQVAEACNYNASATDAVPCVFATGCDSCDGNGGVTDGDANGNGICDSAEVAGCRDSGACNFDAAANVSDDSCVYASNACEVCDGNGGVTLLDDDADGVCNADEVAGCQDATACNYDASATEDEAASCVYADEACEMCSEGAVVFMDVDGDGLCDAEEPASCVGDDAPPVLVLEAVVEVEAPVAEWATLDLVSQIIDDSEVTVTFTDIESMAGGTYQVTRLYTATDACGSSATSGQVLQAAATLPAGCTIAEAINYDASAVNDDGSCSFASDCPLDLSNDGTIGSTDLLVLLSAFGSSCN